MANRQYGYLNDLTEIAEDMEREAAKLLSAANQVRTVIVQLASEGS